MIARRLGVVPVGRDPDGIRDFPQDTSLTARRSELPLPAAVGQAVPTLHRDRGLKDRVVPVNERQDAIARGHHKDEARAVCRQVRPRALPPWRHPRPFGKGLEPSRGQDFPVTHHGRKQLVRHRGVNRQAGGRPLHCGSWRPGMMAATQNAEAEDGRSDATDGNEPFPGAHRVSHA
jgi:hypothetical protein